jgi:hypothetical protein
VCLEMSVPRVEKLCDSRLMWSWRRLLRQNLNSSGLYVVSWSCGFALCLSSQKPKEINPIVSCVVESGCFEFENKDENRVMRLRGKVLWPLSIPLIQVLDTRAHGFSLLGLPLLLKQNSPR